MCLPRVFFMTVSSSQFFFCQILGFYSGEKNCWLGSIAAELFKTLQSLSLRQSSGVKFVNLHFVFKEPNLGT